MSLISEEFLRLISLFTKKNIYEELSYAPFLVESRVTDDKPIAWKKEGIFVQGSVSYLRILHHIWGERKGWVNFEPSLTVWIRIKYIFG